MAPKILDLDHVLVGIGQFKKYQKTTYMCLVIPFIFSSIYDAHYIFTAADDAYRKVTNNLPLY